MKAKDKLKIFLAVFIGIITLAACHPTIDQAAELELNASAEGPFFEGPNSLMAEYEVDVNKLLKSEEFQLDDFSEVKIKDVSLSLLEEDSMSMESFSSASLSIVSKNESMTTIAILNPINTAENEITLSSSEEADLAPFFREGKFTLVVDWDFKEDEYSEQMNSKIKMNLDLKLESN